MLVACRMNYEQIVDHLMDGGARLNDRNKVWYTIRLLQFLFCDGLQEGLTPLMWAAWQSHDVVVKNLLERGAIPQIKDRVRLCKLDYDDYCLFQVFSLNFLQTMMWYRTVGRL